MARLINPRVNRIFSTKVVQLTKELSLRSKCVLVTITHPECPNCIFDPTTKASSGKYRTGGPKPFTGKVCPVCKNKGKLDTETRLQIPANVKWGAKSPQPDVPMPEGFVPIGFVRVKAEVKYFANLDTCDYLLIDGVRCTRQDHPHRRGLQSYVICEMLVKVDK